MEPRFGVLLKKNMFVWRHEFLESLVMELDDRRLSYKGDFSSWKIDTMGSIRLVWRTCTFRLLLIWREIVLRTNSIFWTRFKRHKVLSTLTTAPKNQHESFPHVLFSITRFLENFPKCNPFENLSKLRTVKCEFLMVWATKNKMVAQSRRTS